MEEIKENEYVRLRDGEVTRVKAINKKTFKCKFHKVNCELFIDFIVKHSSNILDLLEVGDVVTHGEETIFITAFESEEQLDYFINLYKHENLSIKSIVTKEQFALAEYRLEE